MYNYVKLSDNSVILLSKYISIELIKGSIIDLSDLRVSEIREKVFSSIEMKKCLVFAFVFNRSVTSATDFVGIDNGKEVIEVSLRPIALDKLASIMEGSVEFYSTVKNDNLIMYCLVNENNLKVFSNRIMNFKL